MNIFECMSNTYDLFPSNLIWSLIFALFFALLFPGYPSIEPTEHCTRSEAERCVELRDICYGGRSIDVRDYNPMSSPMCLSMSEVCSPCESALVGYDMFFLERLVYYGPWWIQWFDSRLKNS